MQQFTKYEIRNDIEVRVVGKEILFCRTMSNTAPAYLEGFQRIVISVDEISGSDDIRHFVSDHKDLTASPELPEFEIHPYMTGEDVSKVTFISIAIYSNQ